MPDVLFFLLLSSQGSNKINGKPEDGYIEFSNGLILQYGIANRNNRGMFIFQKFNKPFPNKCLSVSINKIDKNYTQGDMYDKIESYNNDGMYIWIEWFDINASIAWLAIGY